MNKLAGYWLVAGAVAAGPASKSSTTVCDPM
jgi:hypothetical protein